MKKLSYRTRINSHHLRFAMAATLACTLVPLASAWKPKSHIYLADMALREVKDGKVPFYLVNYSTGQVISKVGDYAVDPAMYKAITQYRGVFNAGVLGPDAYPDIITGQCMIHPENSYDQGSNSWLEHMWQNSKNADPKVRAFVAGFMFHAAGDMYMHTFVNHYAGGPFEMGTNALRHLVLEGYIGKQTPFIQDKGFSIFPSSGDNTVRDWIYQNMIKAPIGSTLENKLLVIGSGKTMDPARLSVPRIFSRLRNYLTQRLDEMNLSRFDYDVSAKIKKAYIKAWIQDIDSGLVAWPTFSEKVARLLVYNPNADMSSKEIKEKLIDACNDYINQHLLSMAGLPDFVGLTRAQISDILDTLLGPFKEVIDEIKESMLNAILKSVTGYTPDEIIDYFNRPENYFDKILGPGSKHDPDATNITLAEAKNLIKQANGQWDATSFAPAYNTIQMTKLILLPKSEVNRLIQDLQKVRNPNSQMLPVSPSVTTMNEDNAMLGFNYMLDGSNQWRVHGKPNQMSMVMAGVYSKLFMKQVGEDGHVEKPVAPPLSANIKVEITRVKSIDDVDPFPGQKEADFYARIEIDDRFKSFETIDNKNTITPGWSLTNKYVGEKVPIRISIFDEDSGVGGGDDPCDISPAKNRSFLKLWLDLATGKITGDVTGNVDSVITCRGEGKDRCEISFKISKS